MSDNRRNPGIVLFASFLTGALFLNSCIKDPILPVLKTEPVTDITINSAKISGEITDDGGAEVTARGFCWGTATDPTMQDDFLPSGTGPGKFAGTIEGLEPNKQYHVRAYAENSVGIAYGNEIVFVTSTAPPAVSTGQISNITASTAVCSGSITYDGGAAITDRGICWSATPEPDLTDFFKSEGAGGASFSSTMTSLSSGTTYYVRAYAKNSEWTVYGEPKIFLTRVSDTEGNLYNTVKIGNQVWMAENLRVTKLNDNISIPNLTDDAQWIGTSEISLLLVQQ